MSFYDECLYLHVAEDVTNNPVIQPDNHEGAHPDMMDPYIVKCMMTS
jgi:hypothetical protein